MRTISVATGRPYNILIERGLIKGCGEEIKRVSKAKRVMIISDTNVFPIYGEAVVNSLKDNGFEVFLKEASKAKGLKLSAPVTTLLQITALHAVTLL